MYDPENTEDTDFNKEEREESGERDLDDDEGLFDFDHLKGMLQAEYGNK